MAITKHRLKGKERHIHYTRYTDWVEASDQLNGDSRFIAYVTDANIWYIYKMRSKIVFKSTMYKILENNKISFFALFDIEGDLQHVKCELIETLLIADQFIDNDGTGSNAGITTLKKEYPFRFSSVGDRHRPKNAHEKPLEPAYETNKKDMGQLLRDYQREADKIQETILERAYKQIKHEQEQLRKKLLGKINVC